MQDLIEAYIQNTLMDDPSKLVPSDLEEFDLPLEDRISMCEVLKSRGSEFQRISSDEECALVAQLMTEMSNWAYVRIGNQSKESPYEEVTYFPDFSFMEKRLGKMELRKGSALGMAHTTAYQFVNHIHVSETDLKDEVGCRHILTQMGVSSASLFGTYDFSDHRVKNYRGWTAVDEVAARAIAMYTKGQTQIPPGIAVMLEQYPGMWCGAAWRLKRLVGAKRYTKYRPFTKDMLKPGWEPAMVLAVEQLVMYGYMTDSRTLGFHIQIRSFLDARGVGDEVRSYLKDKRA